MPVIAVMSAARMLISDQLQRASREGGNRFANGLMGGPKHVEPSRPQSRKRSHPNPAHDDAVDRLTGKRGERLAQAMRVVLVVVREVPELAGFGIDDHESRRGTEVRTHAAVRAEVFQNGNTDLHMTSPLCMTG